MFPILFELGPFHLYSYGLMMVLAFLLVVWLSGRAARTLPPPVVAISADQLLDFCSVALLGGIVGGRLFYVLLNWEFFLAQPLEIPAIWHGGLIWYGGFAGGVTGAWVYVRRQRLDLLRVLDQFIPFLALGHGVGRLGCYLNGCCYGKPTTAWCGVIFPGHLELVVPTQIFEALGLFSLFLILRSLQPAALRRPGLIFGAYLASYAVLRFVLEAFRGDQAPWAFDLTLQQLISLGLLAAGAALIARAMVIDVRRRLR